MNTDTWMPFYPGDYLRDTMHLNTEEHGAYLLLLFCFWLGNGKMEDNDHQFANITRMSVERWKDHFRPVLSKFFIIEHGVWTQKRVQAEKLKANNISHVRSEAGKLGGRPRKQIESKSKANEKQTETPPQSPSPSQLEPESLPPTSASDECQKPAHAPTRDQAKAWLKSVRDNGADYTEFETISAWLVLNANGWKWGKNNVADWRSAIEAKIQDGRKLDDSRKAAKSNRGNPIRSTHQSGNL